MRNEEMTIERLRNGNIRIVIYRDSTMYVKRFVHYEAYLEWKKSVLGY